MNPLTQSKNSTILPLLIALALVCFGLSPAARAVVPPPDGGYPGSNTAEGDNALFSLTTGTGNTAIGFDALFSNTTGVSQHGHRQWCARVATQPAASTRPPVFVRSLATPLATSTRPTVIGAGHQHKPATTTRPTVFLRSLATPDGGATRRMVGQALLNNTTGIDNTANGSSALYNNTTGNATRPSAQNRARTKHNRLAQHGNG